MSECASAYQYDHQVYKKLKDGGLGDFCLHITSTAMNKVQLIEDIKKRINLKTNKISKKDIDFDTSKIKVHVYESITTENETSFEGTVDQLEGKEFSDLSVMVFNQATLESYINFK